MGISPKAGKRGRDGAKIDPHPCPHPRSGIDLYPHPVPIPMGDEDFPRCRARNPRPASIPTLDHQ